jgi:hypothetical protein
MPVRVPIERIPNRIELRVIDVDADYSLLALSAADGSFAGTTEIYGAEIAAVDLATALEGFPQSPADKREVALGSRDKRVAGGWVQFTCRCLDRAGHPVLEVELCDKYAAFGLSPRTAHVHLRVEAPAIDAFVNALRMWRFEIDSAVTLSGAT